MKAFARFLGLSAAATTLLVPVGATRAQLLITGNDEKVSFDENWQNHPSRRRQRHRVDHRHRLIRSSRGSSPTCR